MPVVMSGSVCTLQLDKDAVNMEDNGANTKTRRWSGHILQWKHVKRSRRVIKTAAQSGTQSAEQRFKYTSWKAGEARLIALKTVLF